MADLQVESLVAYRLTVAGLPLRFVALPEGVMLPSEDVPGTSSAIQYQNINCLMPPGVDSMSIDPLGDVAEASGLLLELITDDDAAAEYDLDGLDEALGRVGAVLALLPTGARWYAQVVRDVAADDTTIYIDRSLAAHSYPRLMHIGHEAVWVTAAAGNSAALDAADPYRLTVVRGAAATNAAAYNASAAIGDYPRIYSDLVAWRRRSAVLEIAPVWGIGENAMVPDDGWCEYRRGFIEDSPAPGEMTLRARLHPPASLLDQEIDLVATESGLVQGYHHFEGRRARAFEWAVHTPTWNVSEASDAIVADSGEIAVERRTRHAEAFDVTLPAGHPRAGRLIVGNSSRSFRVTGYGVDPNVINVATGPARAAEAGTPVDAAGCTELKQVLMPEGVAIWPDELIERVNAETDDTVSGIGGAHALLQIVPGQADGWDAVVSSQLFDTPAPRPHVILLDPGVTDDPRVFPLGQKPILARGTAVSPHYVELPDYAWRNADDTRAARSRRFEQLLSYPCFYRAGDSGRSARPGRDSVFIGIEAGTGNRERVFEFASAFYQTGEAGVLLTSPLPDPPGDYGTVIVEWHEPSVAASPLIQAVDYTGVDEVVLPSGETAFSLRLRSPRIVRSFGDWPGLPPASVRVELAQLGAGALLLDLFKRYLGKTADDLDEASFLRHPDPPGLTFSQPAVGTDRVELRDVVHGLLVCTSTALVSRTDATGRNRLTRVSTGLESPVESVATFSDDDFVDMPTYDADQDVVHRVVIRSAYGSDGEPGLEQTFIARGTAPESGGDVQTLEVELRGVYVARPSDLEAIAARIFALRGRPRRTWQLTIPIGRAYNLFPGAVIRVTSDYLRAYSPDVGVVGAYGRVTRVELDHGQGLARLDVIHYGSNGTGWNTALRVIGVQSPTRIVVDGGPWIPEEHPVTGEPFDPMSLWAVGDQFRTVPFGAHDAGVTLTITEIDATDPDAVEIECSGAHGFAGLEPFGEIEPPSYDLASATHKALAYLADDAGTLGAGGVPGFEAV